MRLAVYTDYAYRRDSTGVYAERAFVLFIGELSRHVDKLVLVGRLDPRPGLGPRSHYRVADSVEFVPLPHYERLSDVVAVVRSFGGSVRRFGSVLDDVDAVWLLGPHPLGIPFAAQAARRGRRVFLGVRQDLPQYVRSRHPDRRSLQLAADALEGAWRLMARKLPTIVVGPDLARAYRGAGWLLQLSVSLVPATSIPDRPPERNWDGELTAVSVGRLEAEKNPLLLADVLARLRELDPRWRLAICGEGPLEGPLRERIRELGLEEHAELLGYLRFGEGLQELYERGHALLHVSWTEGVPQILFEAFAAGLPVVATAVGGVPEAAGDAALLVPPGEAEPPAQALARLGRDQELRARLAERGLERVREHTIEAEAARVVRFVSAPEAWCSGGRHCRPRPERP